MATEQEQMLATLAKAMDDTLKVIYKQRMCFFLSVFPPDTEDAVADYISNGKRNEMLKALKETIKRFEKGEIIPVTKGRT